MFTKNVQIYEKIDSSFLASLTGLKKEIIEQIFLVGDTFRVSNKKYKICQTAEENNQKVFLCQVWQ
ncbi:MAG: hypothetical protein NC906_09380 [Candidatus Omnitrophica bacterium]|nr:hypothetical protein [Candidatus Omnitrophota bacterium]